MVSVTSPLIEWTMKLRQLSSLQNPLNQRLYEHLPLCLKSSHSSFKQIQISAIFTQYQSFTSFPGVSEYRDSTPISIKFSKLLLHCCQTKSLGSGQQIQSHITKIGLSIDKTLRNHLINLYSKSRAFGYARKLLDESPEPDLVSWSSLISGYAQNGFSHEAISAFQEMHLLGILSNEFTFPSVLKACSVKKDLTLGKQIHGIVVVTGFDTDVFVANTLVVMYAKCGTIADSRRLFDEIPERNVVSWNALFSCYVQSDIFEEALVLFQEMVSSGMSPDMYSLSSILNACTGLEDIGQGKRTHGFLIKLGYDSDPFSANALVDMYAKAGNLEDAIAVFDEILKPDIVSWNSIIAGCVLHECHGRALEFTRLMKVSGTCPNMFTLSSALKACAGLELQELGKELHSFLIKMDMNVDPFLGVGLIDMYCKCGLLEYGKVVYNLMPQKDLIALNAIISGNSQNGEDEEALRLFAESYKEGIGFNPTTLFMILNSSASSRNLSVCQQVHAISIKSGVESDIYVVNGLIDSYGKCSNVEDARRVFEDCPLADLASFTSMITACAQSGQGEEALKLYLRMRVMEVRPDPFACSSVLNACANLFAYEQGKQIHVHVQKLGFVSDVFAGNSLVDMYAKCGSVDDAGRAFSEIPVRSVVSWSAMIGGLARHGRGTEAVGLFDEMVRNGFAPNHVTLVSVLSACNHAGLVDEARRYFGSMNDLYGIEPTQEHYACMIDLLGRLGRLDEAMELVNEMPFEANASIWGGLLGAAEIHKNVELGRRAAEKLLVLEPEKSGTRVLLANIYASAGMWKNVAEMRRLMKVSNVEKEPGLSWVEGDHCART